MLLAIVAVSPAWADSGPGPVCTGGPATQALVGGTDLQVIAQAPAPHQFAAVFGQITHAGRGRYFTSAFPTPTVSAVTQEKLLVTCRGEDGSVAWDYTIILLPIGSATHSESLPSIAARPVSSSSASVSEPSVALRLMPWAMLVLILVAAGVALVRRPKA